jgi:hypothetical protein
VTTLEHDLYKTKPSTYKILKHINEEVKETANIKGINANTFLHYYKQLWNIQSFNETKTEWNSKNKEDSIITSDELKEGLKLTKNGKSPGEDNINSELHKYAPKQFKHRLLKFLNSIYSNKSTPNEWRNAIVISVFKKGNKQDPINYRGSSILSTCYKIYSKILNKKLQKYSERFISEGQNGFRIRRSCTDATFCLKLLIEKRREYNLDTHLLFLDYEKAFDSVQRQILFNILEAINIPDKLLQAIVDIYRRNKISVNSI